MTQETIEKKCYNITKFFKYKHLPENLQEVSKAFHTLALEVKLNVPDNEEKLMALRKLLEAKDCAVRACL